jgi:hypothetical protein
MPGRGPQTFKKRQKEQERRERQQEKMAKRLQRKSQREAGPLTESDSERDDMMAAELGEGRDNGLEHNG